MFPAALRYLAPRTQPELLDVMAEYGSEAKILTGGQSLVPLLKLRLVRPAVVVDANFLPGLDYVRETPDHIEVGALARHHHLGIDETLRAHRPWLSAIAPQIGDEQVRSLGTLAGTLVEADPAGDWSAAMLSIDAEIVAVSTRGERQIPLTEWFTYSFTPALADDEFVTAVRIPRLERRAGGAYVKVEKRNGDFAVAGCAVAVEQAPDGQPVVTGVGLTGVAYVPLRCPDAASALTERLAAGSADGPFGAETLSVAADAVQAAIDPLADARGSVDYKRRMTSVVFRRAAVAALADLMTHDQDPLPSRRSHA